MATKPLPSGARAPAVVQQVLDPSVNVHERIPKSTPPVKDVNLHTEIYAAPNAKFDPTMVNARCRHYLQEAMRRYKKHKITAPSINMTVFKKELADILREHNHKDANIDTVIRDGGGLKGL